MFQRYFEVIIFKNYSRHLSSVSFGTLETIFIQIFLGWFFFTPLKTTRNCNFTLLGKEKSFDLGGNRTTDLRMRSTVALPTELRGRTEKVACMVPWFPLLGLTTSGLFMGSLSTLNHTSELILCSTNCVHSATRHNIHVSLSHTPWSEGAAGSWEVLGTRLLSRVFCVHLFH